jgi:hypothetical protein
VGSYYVYVSKGVEMKVRASYLFIIGLVLSTASYSSNKDYITNSDSECLNIGYIFFDESNLENVESIFYSRPNDITISYHIEGSKRKLICSNQPFKTIYGETVESILNQDIYYFQDSSDGLHNWIKHEKGFWYSKFSPNNKWLSVFDHEET